MCIPSVVPRKSVPASCNPVCHHHYHFLWLLGLDLVASSLASHQPTSSEPGQAPPLAGTPTPSLQQQRRQPREERNTRQLTATQREPDGKHEDGTSPPPVRRKGASKTVKTATRRQEDCATCCLQFLRPTASAESPPSLAPSRLDWTERGKIYPGPRPVAGLAGLLRPPALPSGRPAISTRRTRRPTHPISPHLIPSISEQRQSKQKALLSCWGAALSCLGAELREKESLGGAFLFVPGSSGGSCCCGGEESSFEVFLGEE